MERCNCRQPERHYNSQPCRVTSADIPLGPNGYCWGCWSAKHDQPAFVPAWVARNIRKDQPLVAVKELSRV